MPLIKQLGVLVLLGVLTAAGYMGWQAYAQRGDGAGDASKQSSAARKPPLVQTAPVEVRDVETLVDAVGSTRALRAVEITPLAPGRITEIAFRAGKDVAAGDVLLRLDDDIQRADLSEAKARLLEARAALVRAQSLQKTSSVSGETVDRQTAALATAQSNLDRAARRLRDRTVTAPFAGTVGFTRVELGARVEDGDTVTTLDDLSSVEIEFSLPEGLFGRIKPGQRIVADAAAFPGRSFDGTIETIESRVDPLARAFKARALIANSQRLLPGGMFMHLAVVLDARRALTVPEEALVVDGKQAFVFTVSKSDKGERAQRRNVTLGQRNFGHVEITDGLTAGEAVIVRGVQRVRDGAAVRLADAAGGDNKRRKAAAQ